MSRKHFLVVVAIAAVMFNYCCHSWAELALNQPEDATRVVTEPENLEPKRLVDKKLAEKSTREPTLKLPEALEIATAHLKEERIDLSGHFLESIRLTEVEGKNGMYWKLKWVPSQDVVGGEIWVHVSMDRRLKPTIERGR